MRSGETQFVTNEVREEETGFYGFFVRSVVDG
jgi:hypothetical protein